jgi:hypothetical protein
LIVINEAYSLVLIKVSDLSQFKFTFLFIYVYNIKITNEKKY